MSETLRMGSVGTGTEPGSRQSVLTNIILHKNILCNNILACFLGSNQENSLTITFLDMKHPCSKKGQPLP